MSTQQGHVLTTKQARCFEHVRPEAKFRKVIVGTDLFLLQPSSMSPHVFRVMWPDRGRTATALPISRGFCKRMKQCPEQWQWSKQWQFAQAFATAKYISRYFHRFPNVFQYHCNVNQQDYLEVEKLGFVSCAIVHLLLAIEHFRVIRVIKWRVITWLVWLLTHHKTLSAIFLQVCTNLDLQSPHTPRWHFSIFAQCSHLRVCLAPAEALGSEHIWVTIWANVAENVLPLVKRQCAVCFESWCQGLLMELA